MLHSGPRIEESSPRGMLNRSSFESNVRRFLAPGIGFLAGVSYWILSLGHAHGQISVLDEGLYLYKGYLFASGVFTPFQDYGPLTNHMPLSFLIPGWIQVIFGPGIRTGRYFSIFLGVLMLLGIWLTARRIAGGWWANAAVWALVLNPALMKMYSQATSQVLVSCILAWILFMVIGEDRKPWQILIGVGLASLLLLTRVNLAPVVIILLAYSYWKCGRSWGVIASIVAVLVIGLGHAFFWPGILRLWANWIPQAWSPFLDLYRLPSDTIPLWDPAIRPAARIGSLLSSARIHWIPIAGFLGVLGLQIPQRLSRNSGAFSGTTWLLLVLFLVLFSEHAWAALGLNYCVFCLRSYMAFFLPIGLLLFAILGKQIQGMESYSWHWGLLVFLFVLPLVLGMPYGIDLTRSILETPVPRFGGSMIPQGTLAFDVQLQNKFGLEFR